MSEVPCPECGRLPTPGTGEGVCPRCLLALGLRSSQGESYPELGIRRLGDYDLLEEVARGGMGVVYKARQRSLQRVVAVKVIASGRLAEATLVRRFRVEAEAAARLHHSGIVPIYEIGEELGLHYFSMRLLEGGTLAAALQARRFSPAETARMMASVARAVHFAHQHGVLHRDIKPANILLDAEGAPSLTDFGLAKLMETERDPSHSVWGFGTPAYMAPERATGEALDTTTASDIYSLGVVLFEMLAGHPLHTGSSHAAILRAVAESEVVSPRIWNAAVDADVETICLRCLERDPKRRYPSAEELAEDLERWLRHEPIRARPIVASERLRKWVARRPAVALLAATTLFMIGVLAVGATVAALQIIRSERAAAQAVDRLEAEKVHTLLERGESGDALVLLARRLREDPGSQADVERLLWLLQRRRWPLPAAPPLSLPEGVAPTSQWSVRFQTRRDGTPLVLVLTDKLLVGDLRAGVVSHTWSFPFTPIAISGGEGRWVALVSGDRSRRDFASELSRMNAPALPGQSSDSPRLWVVDIETGQVVAGPIQPRDESVLAGFDSEGRRVAVPMTNGRVGIFSVPGGEPLMEIVPPGVPDVPEDPDMSKAAAQFVNQDRWVLTSLGAEGIHLWDIATGKPVDPVSRTAPGVQALWMTLDGRRLVSRSSTEAQLFDTRTGLPLGDPVRAVSNYPWYLSEDGGRLYLLMDQDHVSTLEMETGKHSISRLQHHLKAGDAGSGREWKDLDCVTVPDGSCVWIDWREAVVVSEPLRFPGASSSQWSFTLPKRTLAVAEARGTAARWELGPLSFEGREFRHGGSVASVQFSPDGTRLVAAAADGTAKIWSLAAGATHGLSLHHASRVSEARFSPEGSRIATASWDGTARLWDARTGSPLGAPMRADNLLFHVEFNPDGSLLLTSGEDGTVRLYDGKSAEPLGIPMRHPMPVYHAAFLPDGRSILTRPWRAYPVLWDASSGARLRELPEPSLPIPSDPLVSKLGVSPDGRWAAVPSSMGYVTVWDVARGELKSLLRHAGAVRGVAFRHDGQRLLSFGEDRVARVWEIPGGRPVTPPLHHVPGQLEPQWNGDGIKCGVFSPDGRCVATGGNDRMLRLWDADTGLPLTEPFVHQGPVLDVKFSPDGRFLASASGDGRVRVWEVPPVGGRAPAWLPELAEALAGGGDPTEPRRLSSAQRLWRLRTSLGSSPPVSTNRESKWAYRFLKSEP